MPPCTLQTTKDKPSEAPRLLGQDVNRFVRRLATKPLAMGKALGRESGHATVDRMRQDSDHCPVDVIGARHAALVKLLAIVATPARSWSSM